MAAAGCFFLFVVSSLAFNVQGLYVRGRSSWKTIEDLLPQKAHEQPQLRAATCGAPVTAGTVAGTAGTVGTAATAGTVAGTVATVGTATTASTGTTVTAGIGTTGSPGAGTAATAGIGTTVGTGAGTAATAANTAGPMATSGTTGGSVPTVTSVGTPTPFSKPFTEPVTSTPAPQTTAVSFGLKASGGSPCEVKQTGPESIEFTSPSGRKGTCDLVLSSDEPRTVFMEVQNVDLKAGESLILKTILNKEYPVSKGFERVRVWLPSATAAIKYTSFSSSSSPSFDIKFNLGPNICQQVIDIKAGESGEISFPDTPYKFGTMCQWWLRAPAGKKIKLDFLFFEVGSGSPPECSASDYVVVDRTGDPAYGTDFVTHCGSNLPASLTSADNKMNVLGKGYFAGKKGFRASYSVSALPGGLVG